MSFGEMHDRELQDVNEFGDQGIVDNLSQFVYTIKQLEKEITKLGTKEETPLVRDKIRENRLNANKLCDKIEKELQQLQISKTSIFSSKLETTEETERRLEVSNMISVFHTIKESFNKLYFRTKPLDTVLSSTKEVYLESEVNLSQMKEIEVNFEQDQKKIIQNFGKPFETL